MIAWSYNRSSAMSGKCTIRTFFLHFLEVEGMATARCVFAAEVKTEVEHPCGMHSHACTEIVCYLKGSGRLIQQKQHLRHGPGFVSVYQPGTEHDYAPETPGVQVCVGATGCGADALPSVMLKADESVMKCAEQILQEIKQPKARGNQDRLDILAGWLVLEIHRLAGAVSGKNAPRDHAIALKTMIDSRFDETIDLQELAGNLYVSPDYLRHIFKQRVGESPLSYLIRKRLDSACELLNFTSLPVGEIAHRVGLDNAYYFSRIFHKRIGLSPSQYRQSLRKKAQASGNP